MENFTPQCRFQDFPSALRYFPCFSSSASSFSFSPITFRSWTPKISIQYIHSASFLYRLLFFTLSLLYFSTSYTVQFLLMILSGWGGWRPLCSLLCLFCFSIFWGLFFPLRVFLYTGNIFLLNGSLASYISFSIIFTYFLVALFDAGV